MGHVISYLRVSADGNKVKAMVDWSTPTVKELRGFIRLTGYYRRFVRDYGKLARPLTDKLKKNNFFWDEAAEQAFQQLKVKMVSLPILVLPDYGKPFIIEADTSGHGMGAILM